MFCEKCGHNNPDTAKFCAGCGARLAAQQLDQPPFAETQDNTEVYTQPEYTQPEYTQPQYTQPQYGQPSYGQQPAYNQYNSYQPSAALKPQGKSTVAVVLYMIAGGVALLSILFAFLPHITVMGQGFSPLALVSERRIWGTSGDAQIAAVFVILLLAVPALLQLVWAILSFLRTKAAGVLGLIASIFAINHTVVWLALLGAVREKSYSVASMTAVPVLMLILAIAGMVLSIIQMTKKNRVR